MSLVALVGVTVAASQRHRCTPEAPNATSGTAPQSVLPLATERPPRVPIRGSNFPEGALALTWDDGPDRTTLELANYLHSEHISGTFFVVADWRSDLSEEPGTGDVHGKTGSDNVPVLDDLVRLGHRLGSHTKHHVLLDRASPATVAEELGASLRELWPRASNEQKIFRAPGGAWNDAASRALTDSFFEDAVGPIHWDIDGKDWEGSLYCPEDQREHCEPGPLPGRKRVQPTFIAQRYLELATKARRGIVLLHDRVGDVGSHYALNLAHALIPKLKAQGFVFTATSLAFGSLRPRLAGDRARDDWFGDLDGDGCADVCVEQGGALSCARASTEHGPSDSRFVHFEGAETTRSLADKEHLLALADVDGDGRAEPCTIRESSAACVTSSGMTASIPLPSDLAWQSNDAQDIHLADIDGDRRADICVRSNKGVFCGKSLGASFGPLREWLLEPTLEGARAYHLADINGDGRSDLCFTAPSLALTCALSDGARFVMPPAWAPSFAPEREAKLLFGDLNGDGRADVCAHTQHELRCALAGPHRFLAATVWYRGMLHAPALADINGDGRADLCGHIANHVSCAMAP